jgi:DNA-binding response OmpR family regulator
MDLNVLIVDDDERLYELLAQYLAENGVIAKRAATGPLGLKAIESGESYDAVLLDVMLPGLDGLSLLKRVREKSQIPVIMLTAKGDETDRVVGLELGADDYLAKPFSPNELVARVRALLRRVQRGGPMSGSTMRYGSLVVDGEAHAVTSAGVEVALTAKEFLLLEYLLRHRGRVLSRDVLLTDVWGYRYTGGTRTVDVHVRRLREKLPLLADALVTVKQFGYKLVDPAPVG